MILIDSFRSIIVVDMAFQSQTNTLSWSFYSLVFNPAWVISHETRKTKWKYYVSSKHTWRRRIHSPCPDPLQSMRMRGRLRRLASRWIAACDEWKTELSCYHVETQNDATRLLIPYPLKRSNKRILLLISYSSAKLLSRSPHIYSMLPD